VFQCSLNKLTKEFDRKSEEATKLERDNARLQEIVDKVFFQQVPPNIYAEAYWRG